jgi:hypothetical protein
VGLDALLDFKMEVTLDGEKLSNAEVRSLLAQSEGLPLREVGAIAKSVAKWTWGRFDDAAFSRRQSFLGKRGNTKRWAGHEAASATKPWEALSVSRATYYRRKSGAGAP